MTDAEQIAADLWTVGITVDRHPTELIRPHLDEAGVLRAADLLIAADGSRVLAGGVVTHRQRPSTASGVTFLSLEDETGLINVICSVGCWTRHRRVARDSAALLVRGRIERAGGAVNLLAEHRRALPLSLPRRSRDFR